jgi:NAD-dependent SIR2 family protein deacetylase
MSITGDDLQTHSAIKRAAALIKNADGLLITAGAGMGVDSGLPDFRGEAGFWQHYPALAKSHMSFRSIACPDAFRDNPLLAWGFYGHRLNLYRNTTPHDGFHILHKWAQQKSAGYFVFTSNVDAQFQRAGFDGKHVMEVHGSIHHLQCMDNCSGLVWLANQFDPQVDADNCLLLNHLPRCPDCGAIARPNILMFGDGEWVDSRTRQQHAALSNWLKQSKAPVIIEIGAGTDIATVRSFGERQNLPMIRINLRESQVPKIRDVGIASKALDALKTIDALL